jgi:hypothetical protein
LEVFLLVFVRSIIRYVIPGVVTVLLARFVAETVGISAPSLSPLDSGEAVVLGAVAGYGLDAVGAYRFTLSARTYRRTRADLHARLPAVAGETSRDPDVRMAGLWLRMPETYDRVVLERAEWVLVLEIAAVLLGAALVLAGYVVVAQRSTGQLRADLVLVAAALTITSWLASSKGVQRIWAYNRKVELAAAEANRPAEAPTVDREPVASKESRWIERFLRAISTIFSEN